MTADSPLAYQDRLQACVEKAGSTAMRAAHPVNQAMIKMWADALLDKNPVYSDEIAAKATGRAGVIAPPTMIQAWGMPSLPVMANGFRDISTYSPYWDDDLPKMTTADSPTFQAFKILEEKGYVNSAATNLSQVYYRELSIGDHITCTTSLDRITEEKKTHMGVGHFVTTKMEYTDQTGAAVATQRWTLLRFRPYTKDEKQQAAQSNKKDPDTKRSAGQEAATRPAAGDVQPQGAALSGSPEIGQFTQSTVIPITSTFVIASAFATHDFYAIHHDDPWVRGLGQPGIFTNILTTTGLVGGVFTKWAGPNARIESVDLRLLVPNYVGDELTLVGRVRSLEGRRVSLDVTGSNRLGLHVQGVVTGLF